MEPTTPEKVEVETGDATDGDKPVSAAPVETQPETAESDQTDSTDPQAETVEADDDISDWAKKSNLDLSSPDDVKKLAKRFRDTQRSLHQKSREQSELRKQVEEVARPDENTELADDPLAQEVATLKAQMRQQALENNVTKFYIDNPEARDLDEQMAGILKDKPHLAQDLESLYVLARYADQDAIKAEGRKEALSSVAQKQRASAPNASASQPTSKQKITRDWLASLSPEEYRQNKNEIMAAMARGDIS